jgi:hypothetical protein
MLDSSLIKICQQLSKTDLRALKKVVRSPYFNQREDVIRLWDYIAEHLHKNSEEAFDRVQTFQEVFPKDKFDMAILRHTMSFLLTTIRKYLYFEELEETGAIRRIYLNAALKRRGCEELMEKELPEAFAENEKQNLRNTTYYSTDFQLRITEYNLSTSQKRSADIDMDLLLGSYLTNHAYEMLRLGSLAISYKNFTRREVTLPLFAELLTHIESGYFDEKPAILLWYHVFRCLESPENVDNFEKVKSLLPSVHQILSPMEVGEIYLSAINFCIKRLNSGDKEYLRESFDLYKSGLVSGNLLPHGILARYTYNNALVAAMRLQENDWAKQFLEDYKQYLAPKERDNTYRFNRAFLSYHLKDYDTSQTLLQQVVHFDDPLYNLDARRFLVRIYYETGSITALESQLDSYKAFLRRHKEIGYHREHHLNFIKYVEKMITTDLSSSTNKRNIREKVIEETVLAEKDWLLKQLS